MQQISFHDASLEEFEGGIGEMRLAIEGCETSDGYVNAVVTFSGVTGLLADDVEIVKVGMELPDGEIYHLGYANQFAELIVAWTDFKSRERFVKAYEFHYEGVTLEIKPFTGSV